MKKKIETQKQHQQTTQQRIQNNYRNNKNKLDLSMKQTKEKEPEPALFLHRKSKNSNFEDKLGQFLKRSEEKQIDIRRNLKQKQGITKKRK